MKAVAVLPFAAEEVDPDASDLALWLTADVAAELSAANVIEARLVVEAVEIAPAEAARQLGTELALGATLDLASGNVELAALLVAPDGAIKAQWNESVPLGAAAQLPRMLARATLLALGEDSSAPPQSVEPQVSPEAVLRLARAARRIDRGDVDEGTDELLAIVESEPSFDAPRRTLLQTARAAIGGDRMPSFFSALERLADARPDDAEALLALGDYRSLHFDEAGARELYLRARDAAEDPVVAGHACAGLAALAEAAQRTDEAVLHLRAAIKLRDDAHLYARLAALLLEKDATEGLQMLTRATVLAPDDAQLLLALARAHRRHGGDLSKALIAATRAARLSAGDADLAEQVREELQLLIHG
ncbi:MAG: hypothetical protein ABR567_03465 [Myxococcales bacterium]|nr:hypothetical protein [Myxococcales bacterium]